MGSSNWIQRNFPPPIGYMAPRWNVVDLDPQWRVEFLATLFEVRLASPDSEGVFAGSWLVGMEAMEFCEDLNQLHRGRVLDSFATQRGLWG